MATIYLDTSALVKRYVRESGYDWTRRLLAPKSKNRIVLSELGALELEVALARKATESAISESQRDTLIRLFRRHLAHQYNPVPITDTVLKRARRLVRQRGLPHPLRTYDAVHLATALDLERQLAILGLPPPTFVSADRKLLAIARHLGLPTENPEDHP